jgi:very-short-patch-repair endonuclease
MYTCKTCGKEFEKKYSFIGHCSVHNRSDSYKKNRKKEKILKTDETENKNIKKCKYCNLEFNSGLKLGGHQTWCKMNPGVNETKKIIANLHLGSVLSQDHKDKISKGRKEYLNNNPGNIPYLLNHSSKESYPEKKFRQELEKRNICGWKYNYPVKRYALDFAFLEKMLDVEIDGNTHNQPSVAQKDKIRDASLSEMGWTVIRFTDGEIKKNINFCIEKLISFL